MHNVHVWRASAECPKVLVFVCRLHLGIFFGTWHDGQVSCIQRAMDKSNKQTDSQNCRNFGFAYVALVWLHIMKFCFFFVFIGCSAAQQIYVKQNGNNAGCQQPKNKRRLSHNVFVSRQMVGNDHFGYCFFYCSVIHICLAHMSNHKWIET